MDDISLSIAKYICFIALLVLTIPTAVLAGAGMLVCGILYGVLISIWAAGTAVYKVTNLLVDLAFAL